MSVEDRLRPVREIWDSLEADIEKLPTTGAQGREIDRRVAARAANPEAVTPWEVVEARARARLER